MSVNHKYFIAIFLLAVFSISSVANAALVSRLGGLAYYDDVADLTWLADANYAYTSEYDTALGGLMTWADANSWAATLIVDGVDGWRLADTVQPDAGCDSQSVSMSFGYNCTGSEMGNLFYNVLGGSAGDSLTTTHNSNYNFFSNIQPISSFSYWSATGYAPDAEKAWGFSTDDGIQAIGDKSYYFYAWAVQSGDVSAVPVPAAVWLFGSGLLGLIGVAKRKKDI